MRHLLLLLAIILLQPSISNAQDLPADENYVKVNADGHLVLNGKRVRYWGAIGDFPGKQQTINDDPYAAQKLIAKRMKDVGFNMIRSWYRPKPFTKGDLSKDDLTCFFLAECKRIGIKIWAAGMASANIYEEELDELATKIGDPSEAEEWKKAMSATMKVHYWSGGKRAAKAKSIAVVWDERMEHAVIEKMKRNVQTVNPYTGLRFSDDPQNIIWELSNEQWWVRRMTSGQWKKLPAFFKKSLLEKWHAYLSKKYKTEAALTKAWGFLLDGENLEKGTILFAPMAKPMKATELNDTNQEAINAFKTVDTAYTRDDFTFQRGSDVMEFLTTTVIDHKMRWRDKLKTWGKSCKLSPLIFDTGIGYNANSQYMHQLADAVSHDAYMEGVETSKLDPKHQRFPFYSMLDQAPRLCKDVPWLEHNKVKGKPYLCYETQLGGPTKYRVEWPMRIAALASIQDWDAICFHYISVKSYDYTKDNPYEGFINKPGSGATQYHYTFDEVEQSGMLAAAEIFKHVALDPVKTPTEFRYGRKALYDPANMDYAGSYGREGWNMLDTTYRYGVNIYIDPEQEEFVKVTPKNQKIRFNGFEKPNPISPTDQIEFDYQQAHIIFDSPMVASYTGFFAQYRQGETIKFKSGVELSNISHNNPEGMPYPVTQDEQYMEFSLVTADGQPMQSAKRLVLSLVASSFNAGTYISDKGRRGGKETKTNYGKRPVLVCRVGATVKAPWLNGATYTLKDFQLNDIGTGKVENGTLTVPNDKPVFYVEITR